ncbi:hypothetical protein [Kitasatospora cinereorecta]|uniref:Uncharacterized protein n=1 Tax=Kitasatospora cinereorecta TaxID=285560 RepID=A0ABW0VI84_9ACTN
MITFQFSRRPGQGTPSGFDLGDIEITGPSRSARSAGQLPDQGMMIFPSLALLLDQLRRPLASGKGSVVFYGVDSSFKARFSVVKGSVTVSDDAGEIGRVAAPDFVAALLAATDGFTAEELVRIPEADPARADLVDAVADFRELAR